MIPGISEKAFLEINLIFQKHQSVQSAILFGSRAIGTYKPNSDIDIVLKGDINLSGLFQIQNELDEIMLPVKFDVILDSVINNEQLRDHISRVGKVVFTRE